MTKVDEIMELATILGDSRYLAGAGKASREDVQDDCCNLRTAIESLAKDAEARSWQPIETAPKDGTAVMVYPPTWNGRSASIATWKRDKFAKKPRPYWDRDDDMGRVTISRELPTTHWMPMPELPGDAS